MLDELREQICDGHPDARWMQMEESTIKRSGRIVRRPMSAHGFLSVKSKKQRGRWRQTSTYVLNKVLTSKRMSNNAKIKIYKTILHPTLTCET